MSSLPETLRPAPPRFQRFAWHGIALLLPEDWNLRLHHGNARSGALVFADLHATRLELRWRTPPRLFLRKNPLRLLDQTLRRLKKRHPAAQFDRLSPAAIKTTRDETATLLAADAHRLYELHWPAVNSSENFFDPITADFLHHLPLASAPGDRFWSLYGATGSVPAAAKLQKISLLPGAVTLTFKHHRGAITLGSFSMADRLLAQGGGAGSLRHWAATAIPIIARFPKGRWEESPDESRFLADTRRRFRPARHLLSIRHDPAANRLIWTHHFAPCEKPAP